MYGDHEEGLGEESFGVVFEKVEGYFDGGREENYAADFDAEGADLLAAVDESVLEEVADDGEESDARLVGEVQSGLHGNIRMVLTFKSLLYPANPDIPVMPVIDQHSMLLWYRPHPTSVKVL